MEQLTYEEKVLESQRLMWYLCMYMYMLYCEADTISKGIHNIWLDPSYIWSKIGYFFRSISKSFRSMEEFADIASRNTSAESIYKHMDVWLWIKDYCIQNYPQKLVDFILKNEELSKLFPEEKRDENWFLL